MTMKYWRMKLKGERSLDDVQGAISHTSGNLLRIHVARGETHVYFAAPKETMADAAKAGKDAVAVEEISVDEVTKFS